MRLIVIASILSMSVTLLAQERGSRTAAPRSVLEGAWQVMDASNGVQTPGLYIFLKQHYSMLRAAADRPDIADLNAATADELRTLFVPLAADAGRGAERGANAPGARRVAMQSIATL